MAQGLLCGVIKGKKTLHEHLQIFILIAHARNDDVA